MNLWLGRLGDHFLCFSTLNKSLSLGLTNTFSVSNDKHNKMLTINMAGTHRKCIIEILLYRRLVLFSVE